MTLTYRQRCRECRKAIECLLNSEPNRRWKVGEINAQLATYNYSQVYRSLEDMADAGHIKRHLLNRQEYQALGN